MPNWPALLTTTSAPVRVVPLIPAIKVLVCAPLVPMRMVFDSAATPRFPISMLLFPVVRF